MQASDLAHTEAASRKFWDQGTCRDTLLPIAKQAQPYERFKEAIDTALKGK